MINSFFSYIKNNYSVVITLILFAALELPFLSLARPILTDEAWYSNPAYNFLTLHSFENTNIGYGGNGLLIFLLYLSSNFFVFGVSLFSLRFSSFIMGVVSLFIVGKMLKILNVKEFNRLLSLSFFIFANLYLSIFKLGRPEALTFMLSLNILLVSYYYIVKNFDFKYLALLVVLIFLAINSHPNSSIIVLLSFLVILFYVIKEKQFKKIFHLALIVAAVAVSLYVMISVISMNNKIGIVDSMNDLVDRNAVNSGFIEQLISKFKVTIEYFVSSSRFITFLPQVLLIISGLFMWKKDKNLFGLSLCGLASLFIAFIFLAPPGFIYVFPYAFIFSVLILSVLLKTYDNKSIAGKAISAIVIVIVLLNIIAYITLSRKTYDSNIGTKMKEIAAMIPDNSITVSVPPFWFISPEKNFKTARYFRDRNINLSDKDFYLINCDKFENDIMASSSSLASLDTNSSSRKIDTLLIKNSSIYGNIYLMKYSVNSIK
jgi:hypothetical protein